MRFSRFAAHTRSMLRVTGPKIDGVRRIAVVRAGGIGDLMFALPALKSLKAGYPNAELTLLAADWQGELLAGRGIVDRVIEMPAYEGVRGGTPDAVAIELFFRRVCSEGFDLAVQMHGGGRNSNPFVQRLGARVTAGLRTPDAAALDINVPYVYLQPEVFRLLEVAAALGCEPVEIEPSLPVLTTDRLRVPESLSGGAAGKPFVLLSPGASDPRRRWGATNFGAVARSLGRAGIAIAIVGSEEDRLLAEAIREQAPEVAVLAGELSLTQFVGLAARADLLVGNDSGPLNVARAVGTATVGIYWIGNVINAGALTRSRQRLLASWQVACPRCGADMIYRQCEHGESFVAGVSVEEVLYNAFDLLGMSDGEDFD